MSDVTITVRGESVRRILPERATVHITVRAQSGERTDAVERVLAEAERLRSALTARATAGNLVDWASKRLATRSERPWHQEGEVLPLIHHASVDFSATFADASELSHFVSEVSVSELIEVGWVQWDLTDETRASIEQQVATAAVTVAAARARAYADALGLSSVTPVEIADRGLISPSGPIAEMSMMKSAGSPMRASAASAPAMEFEPDDIEVSATIEARFRAS